MKFEPQAKKPSKRNVISVVQSDYNVVTVVYDVVDYFPVFISLLIVGLFHCISYSTAYCLNANLSGLFKGLFWSGVGVGGKITPPKKISFRKHTF